jgi:lysophospholipase
LPAPAPLISIPEAPAPVGARAEWFEGPDGARLRAAVFPPASDPRGAVVLSPGRTEPIEKYFETIGDLTSRGLLVLAHDWRGQGLSQRALPDRLKGHASGFEPFLGDYRELLDRFGPQLPQPWIALGHSMGGCLTLLALANGETRFSAAALSAPMLGIALGGAPKPAVLATVMVQRMFGRSGELAVPAYDPLADLFEDDKLTHDRARYDRYKAQLRACPDLAIGALTWGWLDFAFAATAAIAAPGALEDVPIPLTIVAAEDDRLVLNAASRAAAARLPKGRYVEAAGAYHEILMETDERRALFFAELDALLTGLRPPPA